MLGLGILGGCRSSAMAPSGQNKEPLPQVFVVGDSISMHYGPYLEQFLSGKMRYARKTAEPDKATQYRFLKSENGGDSSKVLEYLRYKFSLPEFHPDYLLVNCGLHDLKIEKGQSAPQVSPDQYEKNLDAIFSLAKQHKTTLIWLRTTPVHDEKHSQRDSTFHRYDRDVEAYNEIADRVAQTHGIPLIDLSHFTKILGPDATSDGVHYIESVRQQQAAFIAGFLLAMDQNRYILQDN